MRVIETRHNEVPAEIDDLYVAMFQLQNLFVGSDGEDAPIANGNGLGARQLGLGVLILRGRVGVDITVDEENVRRGLFLGSAEGV